MEKPKLSDSECIDRLQAAAEELLSHGGSPSQVVGALTAAIAKVAWQTPQQANRSLRLAADISPKPPVARLFRQTTSLESRSSIRLTSPALPSLFRSLDGGRHTRPPPFRRWS